MKTTPATAGGPRRRRWPRAKLHRILAALTLLFTLSAGGLFAAVLREHVELPGEARDFVLWNAVQLEREYAAMMRATERHAEDPSAAGRDAAGLAYDVFYNRIRIATQGEFGRALAVAGQAGPIETIRDNVFAAEPLADAMLKDTPGAARAMSDALAGVDEPLSQLLSAAVQLAAERAAAARDSLTERYVWLAALFLGLLVSVAAFIVLLFHQLRVIRGAHGDLQSMLDVAADGVFAIGADARIRYANPAAAQIFGCAAAQAVGRPVRDLLPGLPAVAVALPAPDGEPGATHEIEGRRLDGEHFTAELSIGKTGLTGAGRHTLFVRDVSARRRAEEQLRHRQKLEVIGRLAGGVAHDFNNLLMIIDGYARRALRSAGDREQVAGSLAEVMRASQSAATLTRQLLTFSGRRSLDLRVVRLGETMAEIAVLLRPMLGEAFRLVVTIPDETLLVETDPGELTHAIINLAVNARDAMPDGGEICIEVAGREAPHDALPALPGGRYAEIAVRDHGIGMDEATLARIFDPFFTTKGENGGTGLGLAMVYGFAQQSGGTVTAASTRGAGATFRLYLPLSEAAPTALAGCGAEAPAGRGETVLLVEDNPAILRLTRATLERLGYAVLAADGAVAALEVDQAHAGPIDLLVSDVVMPAIGGIELAEMLRGGRPELRVLFISGYPAGSDLQPLPIPHGMPLLRKPFRPEELAHAVRSVLTARSLAA